MRWLWPGSPDLAALPASPLLHLALLPLPPEFPLLSLDSSLAALGFPGSVLLSSSSCPISLLRLVSLPRLTLFSPPLCTALALSVGFLSPRLSLLSWALPCCPCFS